MELLRITRQLHCKAVEQRATLIHRQYNRDWSTSYSRPPIDPYLTSPLLQNPGGATAYRYRWIWSSLTVSGWCQVPRRRVEVSRVAVKPRPRRAIGAADFHRATVATAPREKLLTGRRPARNWTRRTISRSFLCRKLHLLLGKPTKTAATRAALFDSNMHQIVCRLSPQTPYTGGAHSAPPTP